MSQTYGELMKEIVSMPYSKDMFNLEKECAELSVLESYIENQQYLSENFDDNVNVDYMLEAANESTIKKIMNSIGTKITNIGKKIWDLFMNLLDMIGRAAGAIVKWFRKRFNKETFTKCKNNLTNTLSAKSSNKNESVVYTESDNMLNPTILSAFKAAYLKAQYKFDHDILKEKNNKQLTKMFNMIKDVYVVNESNNNWISIREFYLIKDIESPKYIVDKLKKFIDICDIIPIKVVFDFGDNNFNFPIISIDDFCNMLSNTHEKFNKLTTGPKGVFGQIENGLMLSSVITFITYLINIKSKFVTLDNLMIVGAGSIGAMLSVVLIDSFNKIILGKYKIDDPKYPTIFEVNLEKSGDKVYEISTKFKENFNNSFKNVEKILGEYMKKYKEDIVINNDINDTDYMQIGKKIFKKACNAIGIDYKARDTFLEESKGSKTYAIYIKKYYEINSNIMTLIYTAENISNILLNMAREINNSCK